MVISKDEFIKDLEDQSNKLKGTKLYPLVKDINDCVVFACIFVGNKTIIKNSCFLEKQAGEFAVCNKKTDVIGQGYEIESYNGQMTLKVVLSDMFCQFEKENDCGTYKYKSVYNFDKLGNFVRKANLVHEIMFTKQDIDEICFGTSINGVYLTKTYEKVSNMNVEIFKLPDEKNNENLFYSYSVNDAEKFMCKATPEFKNVPYLEMIGMSELSTILTEQFSGSNAPLKIDDSAFFKQLLDASKQYYVVKDKKNKQ